MVGKILRLRLQLLAIRDFFLEPLIGVDQPMRPLFNAALEILVGFAQFFVGRRHLLLGAPAAQLRVDPCQRHCEIDGLGNVIVGALLERIDNIVAFRFGGDHDDRQCGRGFPATNTLERFHSVDARHHDVEENEIERVVLDHVDRDQPGLRLSDIESPALKTPLENRAIVADVIDDQETRLRLRPAIRRRGNLIRRRKRLAEIGIGIGHF